MRGKPGANGAVVMGERIIPAHAGQTPRPRATPTARTDHPRACGANSALRPSNILQSGSSPRMRGKPRPLLRSCGSSPRMRGKHAVAGAARRVVRIIPAHAGQTSGLTYPMPSVADHPRACGANFRVREVVDAYAGSSPRMRGKPERLFVRACRPRIIPAHAGQTAPGHRTISRCSDHPRACGANRGTSIECPPTGGSSPRMRGKPAAC